MTEPLPTHVQFRRDHQIELFLAIVPIFTIPIAVGLWRAQEWARVAFGIMAALIASVGMGLLLIRFMDSAPIGPTIGRFCIALMWAFAAHHVLQPTARKSFATARESIARTRAALR